MLKKSQNCRFWLFFDSVFDFFWSRPRELIFGLHLQLWARRAQMTPVAGKSFRKATARKSESQPDGPPKSEPNHPKQVSELGFGSSEEKGVHWEKIDRVVSKPGPFPLFSGKVRIVSRTISGLFLVGAVNRLRRGQGQIGKIPGQSPDSSGKSRKNRESPKKDKKKDKIKNLLVPPF